MDSLRAHLPSRRFLQSKDLLRAAGAAALTLVVTTLLFLPELALAGGTSVNLGIVDALKNVRKFLTGEVVQIAATIAMVAVLGGVIVRSQRGESITSLVGVGVALVLITNIENVLNLLGISSSSPMASMTAVAESALMVTP